MIPANVTVVLARAQTSRMLCADTRNDDMTCMPIWQRGRISSARADQLAQQSIRPTHYATPTSQGLMSTISQSEVHTGFVRTGTCIAVLNSPNCVICWRTRWVDHPIQNITTYSRKMQAKQTGRTEAPHLLSRLSVAFSRNSAVSCIFRGNSSTHSD